jgi:hypothetical protein
LVRDELFQLVALSLLDFARKLGLGDDAISIKVACPR